MPRRFLTLFLLLILVHGCRRQPPVVQVEEPASLAVTVESAKVQVEPGLSTRVKVSVARKNVADAVKLELADLPAGLSASSVTLGASDSSAEIELTAAPGLEPGEKAGLRATATAGEVKGASSPFYATVLKPSFTCVYGPTGLKIPKGQSRQLKVTVQRAKEAYQGPIEISLANVPKGLTVTQGANAADGSGTATFALQAAPGATEGEHVAHVRIEGGRELRGVALLPVTVVGAPFTLKVDSAQVAGVFGKSTKVKIIAARRDYQGPITIRLSDLPPQVKASSFTLPAKETSGEVELSVSPEAMSSEKTIQVNGSADDGRSAVASFDLSVEGKPFSLHVKPKLLEVVQGESAKLKVSVVRSKGFTGPISIEVRNLPKDVKGTSFGIPLQAKEADLDIAVGDAANIGVTQGVQIVGIAPVAGEKREIRGDTLTLGVLPVFNLQVLPAKVEFVEGQKATVTVKAMRKNYKGSIALAWKNLPVGVTASEAQIPRDKDSIEVELTAGPGSGGKIKADVHTVGSTFDKKQVASSNVTVTVISRLFELKVEKTAKITMGSKAFLRVSAQRTDYEGPIALEVKDLPSDVKAAKAVIPAGKSEIDIELAAADQVKDVKADIHILGTATAANNQQRQSSAIQLQIIPGLFDLKIEPALVDLHHGGMTKLTVTAQRKGYDGPIAIELKNLPMKVSAEKVTIAKGESKAEIEVKAQLTVLEGAKVDVYARGSGANKAVDSSRLTINIASVGQPPGVELKVEPASIKLTAGEQTKVKVKATRNGYKGPLMVDLRNLPAEVESSKGMIAEGASEVEITLTARAKAEPTLKLDVCAVGIATAQENRAYASPHVGLQVSRK